MFIACIQRQNDCQLYKGNAIENIEKILHSLGQYVEYILTDCVTL